MMHFNPAALPVSPKRPWECCRDFRRCPMSLRLHRDGHHLRFGTGSHWYLPIMNMYAWPIGSTFTIKFHQTWVKYAPYMDPLGNINTSETLRTSSLSLNKGKANYLTKTACTNHQFPATSSLATSFNISLGAYWCEQCIYNLHHSSLKACNRYHHHSSIIFD